MPGGHVQNFCQKSSNTVRQAPLRKAKRASAAKQANRNMRKLIK